MSITQADVEQLIANREPEGLYLDFKRGASLSLGSNDCRTELVKDCTGFANAAGGTIIYGIAEAEIDGVAVAAELAPVMDSRATRDWIGEVLRSNSSPPLTRFHVSELPQAMGGRVVAIEVEAASTAHQSLRDHKYYQRSGAATVPMVDFQIRDVMARRSKPEASVNFRFGRVSRTAALHRNTLEVAVENTGAVTLEKWWLDIELPADVVRDTRNTQVNLMILQPNFSRLTRSKIDSSGRRFVLVGYGDPWQDGERCLVHPGQVLTLDRGYRHFAEVLIEMDQSLYESVHGWPLRWVLYFNNSAPLRGEVPFDEWCTF